MSCFGSNFKGQIPAEIFEALAANRCVLFVGAGLSRGAVRSNGCRLPDWKGLLLELVEWMKRNLVGFNDKLYIEEIIASIESNKLLEAAQALQDEMEPVDLARFYKSVFRDESLRPTDMHFLLPNIPFRAILTTNYDKLIEMAHFERGKHFPVYTQRNIADAINDRDHFICKLHGDVDYPETMVLGYKDYNELVALRREYTKFLENIILNNLILFVGYSANDPDLTLVLNNLTVIFGQQNQKHYLLQYVGERNRIERKALLQGKHLEIIEYERDEAFSQVGEFLKALADHNVRMTEEKMSMPKANHLSIVEKLREGSRKYFQKLRNLDGRFCHLDISELLFSDVQAQLLDAVVGIEDQKLSLKKSLEYLWTRSCKHAVIVGEGGMGKTVSMLQFWEDCINNSSPLTPIPVFLPLNEYNNSPKDQLELDNYIINKIGQKYLGKEHLSEAEEETIYKLLDSPFSTGKMYIPSIILLLDGFNEVTVGNKMLLVEINKLVRNFEGLQLIITSRYDMRYNFNWVDFCKLQLMDLDEIQIKQYLREKTSKEVGELDDRKLKLLGNPMMLTIYAASCELVERSRPNCQFFDFKENPETPGEMLWNFTESLLVKEYQRHENEPKKFTYSRIIVKYLLPYIGYCMEKMGRFDLEENLFKDIFSEWCKLIQSDIFEDNLSMDEELKMSVSKFSSFKNYICEELFLIVKEKSSYRFLHQHFRDYFSAVHILNQVNNALKMEQLPTVLSERTLPVYISRFIGEIEGEHRNVLELSDKGWSMAVTGKNSDLKMTLLLEKCRHNFKDVAGYIVWNILQIWKDVHRDLTSVDLSFLNLSKVSLNNVKCSRWFKEETSGVRFIGALIGEKNVFPQWHTSKINDIVYSNDFKKILSFSRDRTIKEWDVETGECLRTYIGHHQSVTKAIYSNDAKKILSCSDDGTLKEWEISTGVCLKTYFGHKHPLISAIYSKNGSKILSWSEDNTIKEWDVETGNCLRTYVGHISVVINAMYNVKETRILSCSGDGTIKEWAVQTGECLKTFVGHNHSVCNATYNNNERKILSCSVDGTIKEWDVEAERCLKTYGENKNSIITAMYSQGEKKILSCSTDGIVQEWDVETGECLLTYIGHNGVVIKAMYSGDGKKILSCSWDSTIKEWDVKTGLCLKTYFGHEHPIKNAIYNENDRRILSCSTDGKVKEWEVETGECLKTYTWQISMVTNAVYSADGKRILACSGDGTVREWEVETGKCIRIYTGHETIVNSAIYIEAGKKILSNSEDGVLKEWEVETGVCTDTYVGKLNKVGGNMYSERNDKVAGHIYSETYDDGFAGNVYIEIYDKMKGRTYSETYDKTLSWANGIIREDILRKKNKAISEKEETSKIYVGHESEINNAVYSSDGKKILSCSNDGTIKEWDTETGKCMKTLINVPGLIFQGCDFRNLHPQSQIFEKSKEILRLYKIIID